jgi:hypothetical protein
VPRDLGLAAHLLRDRERLGEQRMQRRSDRLAGLGEREGVLHLSEDLGLADHHRVEARGDPEGVSDCVRLGERVERRLDSRGLHAAMAAELAEHQ